MLERISEQTKNFGKIAYIEIGAMMVGLIKQTHRVFSSSEKHFKRGEEKGKFLFGASSAVIVGEAGRWAPHEDILEKTNQGTECLVRLGETIATKI